MCAADETILLCDITCDVNDAIWNADPDALGQVCARELEQEGFIKTAELVEAVVLRSTFGYPVEMVGYETSIDTPMPEIMRFPATVTAGRPCLAKPSHLTPPSLTCIPLTPLCTPRPPHTT